MNLKLGTTVSQMKNDQWTEDLCAQQYGILCERDGNIVLADEHCSHIPAWQEGLTLSSTTVAYCV